jgi:hypothetical protein
MTSVGSSPTAPNFHMRNLQVLKNLCKNFLKMGTALKIALSSNRHNSHDKKMFNKSGHGPVSQISITGNGNSIQSGEKNVFHNYNNTILIHPPSVVSSSVGRPDLALRFVYPASPALIIVNQSAVIAKDIKWAVVL